MSEINQIKQIQFNMPTKDENGKPTVTTTQYTFSPSIDNIEYNGTPLPEVIENIKKGTVEVGKAESASSCTGNAATATKLETPRSIEFSGAITTTAQNFDGSANINFDVSAIDGSKITGTIPLSAIPSEALSVKIFHVGNSNPLNTNLLWIDTNETTGGLKYYDTDTFSWKHVPMGWA